MGKHHRMRRLLNPVHRRRRIRAQHHRSELRSESRLRVRSPRRKTRATLNFIVTNATQSLLDAALQLPDQERAEFAAILADSVGDGTSPAEVDAAWIAEAKQRLTAVRAGASVVESDEVERELDQLVDAAAATRHAG